ncbi:hypothetical protein CY34DRAFT_211229 [Suillus luteus UH-Slu-Lm8-n1]|uniref:Uncharacterized protein n=1 Tax=Suillus luteus UH-Slu-Lm8-n1 TaxID=930992 RepID=A0A0D0BXI4_9AGAM|nr:hypothetical protein CY34DRAFT_211229 [Suillus luteus UH-Slu-Lm8-n1]
MWRRLTKSFILQLVSNFRGSRASCGRSTARRKTRCRSVLPEHVQRFEGWWCYGLYEGGLDTSTRSYYTRSADESAARAEDGFHSYRYVMLAVLLPFCTIS